ncbi:Hypothetical protein HVR_LOCUS142 [uncultured virus]|nr:Hypothetical protein HVR_LOCUS142 [uncultured virus]
MDPYLVKIESTSETEALIKSLLETVTTNLEPRTDFHCTLIFARTYNKQPTLIDRYETPHTYTVKGIDVFETAVVMLLDVDENSFLVKRHHQLMFEMSAKEDFSTYNPHTTIGYLVKDSNGRTLSLDLEQLRQTFVGIKVSLERETGKVFVN